jgi:SpoVK/Ycf46/Vps4 family AAA+-type ATPase
MSDDMTDKFRIFRRSSKVWYLEDKETGHQESLRTRDATEAKRLLHAKNEANRQPAINIQIARAYLSASDPKLITRTWQDVMDTLVAAKMGENRKRWVRAIKDRNFDIIESAELKAINQEHREKILDAASGMTTIEAENAMALSVVQTKKVDQTMVAREKAQVVKKNGLLEIIESKETLESIGGLDVLKDWLVKRKEGFSQKAIEYGLPTPKGLLIVGISGAGKSLTAKATAQVLGVPLLKLDAGRIFGGLVGQSEGNLRSMLQTAEAIAPCCLWIDELEKGFSGSRSSNSTDGGTSARVFGSFISWMQEKKSPVFIVATANDVSQLPPELLRKGRFDELFFVDLPNQSERESIWAIQIQKYGRDAKDYDLVQLAKATDGLTGSEIENVFVDALFQAFEEQKEPTDLTIAQVLNDFVPLSKLMAEQITGLRQWSKGRARSATSVQSVERRLRKIG